VQGIEETYARRHEAAYQQLQQTARARRLAMVRTKEGIIFAPVMDDKIISPEEFDALPEETRADIKKEIDYLKEEMEKAAYRARQLEKEQRAAVKSLNREMVRAEVEHLMADMRQKYADLPAVLDYLQTVQTDVTDSAEDFRRMEDGESAPRAGMPLPRSLLGPAFLRRYRVNLLVDHSANHGTPVVYVDHPTYPNLVGRIENMVTQSGSLMTDFTLVKPGALHRANGGYLILDAHKILA